MEIVLTTQFISTFCIFAACVTVILLMRRKAMAPRDSLDPGLVPPLPVALGAGIVAVLSFIHLMTLLGLHQ